MVILQKGFNCDKTVLDQLKTIIEEELVSRGLWSKSLSVKEKNESFRKGILKISISQEIQELFGSIPDTWLSVGIKELAKILNNNVKRKTPTPSKFHYDVEC